jgi:hypothetical protein
MTQSECERLPLTAVPVLLLAVALGSAATRGGGAIPWLPTRPPQTAEPPLARPCQATALRARLQQQGTLGSLLGVVAVRNSGRAPCSLRGRRALTSRAARHRRRGCVSSRLRPTHPTPASSTIAARRCAPSPPRVQRCCQSIGAIGALQGSSSRRRGRRHHTSYSSCLAVARSWPSSIGRHAATTPTHRRP